MLYNTWYILSYEYIRVQEYRQIPRLEPDPRRVLRSLGQDAGPAARTATTHTWARGGARRHGGIRAAPYTMRGAAGTGRACTAAAAATAKKARGQRLRSRRITELFVFARLFFPIADRLIS